MHACSSRIVNEAIEAHGRVLDRVLFLDRDGVININHGYVHTAEQTDWVPGIFDLCRTAQSLGYAMIVVTNQAGIGRGLYSEAQFEGYTRWMIDQFAERGIDILAVYYCPHHPTAGLGRYRKVCDCRKPAPGMLQAAANDYDVALGRSVLVGDKCSDMAAGSRAGVGALVLFSSTETCSPAESGTSLQLSDLSQVREFIAGLG